MLTDDSVDLPPRTPSKPSKNHDDESVSSSKRDTESPVLRKATATIQLRSTSCIILLFLLSISQRSQNNLWIVRVLNFGRDVY